MKHSDIIVKLLREGQLQSINEILNHNYAELDFSNQHLTTTELQLLAEVLRGNHTVRSLSLVDNQIKNEGIIILSHMLTDNNSLKFIDLSCNLIEYEDVLTLEQAIAKNNTLEHIDLHFNIPEYDFNHYPIQDKRLRFFQDEHRVKEVIRLDKDKYYPAPGAELANILSNYQQVLQEFKVKHNPHQFAKLIHLGNELDDNGFRYNLQETLANTDPLKGLEKLMGLNSELKENAEQ